LFTPISYGKEGRGRFGVRWTLGMVTYPGIWVGMQSDICTDPLKTQRHPTPEVVSSRRLRNALEASGLAHALAILAASTVRCELVKKKPLFKM
jgi:hypothetical protein